MDVKKIVICKSCRQPEYWGDMRWLSGRCMCRDCYKADYERQAGTVYKWDDLEGKRPTKKEYEEQEEKNNEKV